MNDISRRYRSADFVIATAGALTLNEIAACELPALIVPLGSASGQHQHANARNFSEHTGALVCDEDEFDSEALEKPIVELLSSPDRWNAACKRTNEFPVNDNTASNLETCFELMDRRHPKSSSK